MEDEKKVRVKFVTKDSQIRVAEVPIAIPLSCSRNRLSEIINHLLAKTNPEDALSFEFLIHNQILQDASESTLGSERFGSTKHKSQTLEDFFHNYGINTEITVTIEYFIAIKPPSYSGESNECDEWLSCVSGRSFLKSKNNENASDTIGSSELETLYTAGYDGKFRFYTSAAYNTIKSNIHQKNKNQINLLSEFQIHDDIIKAMVTFENNSSNRNNLVHVITGGKDKLIKAFTIEGGRGKGPNECSPSIYKGLLTTYSQHDNSIEALDVNFDGTKFISGDWDGMLYGWSLSFPDMSDDDMMNLDTDEEEDQDIEIRTKKKARTGAKTSSSSKSHALVTHQETSQTLFRIKAHQQGVSSLKWSSYQPNHVYSSSHDHSIKLWDIEKQDCLNTINQAKVITCMDVQDNTSQVNLIATGQPDHRIKLWDMKGQANNLNIATLRGHTGWVSDVKWHPSNEYILASVAHDGSLKIWDTRATNNALSTHVPPSKNRNTTTKKLKDNTSTPKAKYLPMIESQLYSCSFARNGHSIYICGREGVVTSYDVSSMASSSN